MDRKKAAIFALSLLTIMSTDTVAPLVKQISTSFPNIDLALIKQTITLPSLMMIFFGLIAGQLVRVIPKKTVLFIGLALYSVGGMAAGWSQNFSSHLMLRAMLGAGTGLISPVITSLIADYYQGKERADLVGYSFALSHFTAVVTPPLAAYIGAQNWRTAFWIYLIAPLVMIFAMLALPGVSRSHKEEKQVKKEPIPSMVFAYSAAALLTMVFFFIILTDLPYLIETKPGISQFVSAFGLSISTFGSTLAGLVFSRIFRYLKRWTVPLGLLLCGAGFWIATTSMAGMLVMSGLLCIGTGIGLIIALIMLETTNSVGENDSTAAIALVNSAFSVGIFLSPFFFAGLPKIFHFEENVLFNFQLSGMVFSICGLGALILILLPKKRQAIPTRYE
ncbi:MAG: MFS transporter [Chloroflexi bacterium]|jgi:predicted MFS family arabinose efflux permease|nr:MFS transporter [Chloroflexota bacterium]